MTLQQQIVKNEELAKQARLDYLEDGKKQRERIENERSLIHKIKEQKVAHLDQLSIEDKYKVELRCHKISF